jgi:hypothetical protein
MKYALVVFIEKFRNNKRENPLRIFPKIDLSQTLLYSLCQLPLEQRASA